MVTITDLSITYIFSHRHRLSIVVMPRIHIYRDNSVLQNATELSVSESTVQEMWEEAYAINKRCWLKVMSNSMFPLLEVGDRVFVEFVPLSRIASGDIVTYRFRPGMLMSHRIVGRTRKNGIFYFFEKADRGFFASLISQEAVIGKITKIQKSGRRIFELENSFMGIFNRMLAFHSMFIFCLHKSFLSKRAVLTADRKGRYLLFLSTRVLYILSLLPSKVFAILRNSYCILMGRAYRRL